MTSRWSTKPRSHFGSADTTPQSPSPPFGSLLQTINVGDLNTPASKLLDCAAIRDVSVVSSYNWVDRKDVGPTILVPGKPPLWTPSLSSQQLNQDSGTYFRDRNAARYPHHPIEPAVLVCLDADLDSPSKTDIVACNSTLGNLLRAVRGGAEVKPFRMLLEKIGNTLFLIRRENSPTELIPGVRGFGHTFPEAYTSWEPEVKGSCSHQRLLRYTFGGLHFVVRYEADGYIKHLGGPATSSAERASTHTVDDIVNDMLSVHVLSEKPTSSPAKLEVKTAGSLVEQKDVFDLKTRSILTKFKKDHVADEIQRLWVTQTPNFVLAYHNHGRFSPEEIDIIDVRGDVKAWEKTQAPHLARLAALEVLTQRPISPTADHNFGPCFCIDSRHPLNFQPPQHLQFCCISLQINHG